MNRVKSELIIWLINSHTKQLALMMLHALFVLIYSISKGIAEGRKWFSIAMSEACLVDTVYLAAADFEAKLGYNYLQKD